MVGQNQFLDLIKDSQKGKFKIYLGMSAGVGKSYRMLQEARTLINNGIDVKIGYIETHQRKETQELVGDLPIISRKSIFYKGKSLEEMDLKSILQIKPEVVIVDELAHTNIEGGKNEKRWQDVIDILNAGINVISAINIQHIESLNEDVENITGIKVAETVPDSIIQLADEIIQIDLTADELIERLKEGKIYKEDKIQIALNNFFKIEQLLQLRELANKETAHHLERKIAVSLPPNIKLRKEKILACISTNPKGTKQILRKTARLASYYQSKWIVLYVQRENENPDKVKLDLQRHLINHFKLATELGAEVIKVKGNNVADIIFDTSVKYDITTICIGKPKISLIDIIFKTSLFDKLLRKMDNTEIDLVIIS
jgi:two-component system sensor histidine kinase KdpD